MYDIAIVGAGINGCSVAYAFAKEGKKVLLLDAQGIAHGGSGAAGAFISPKFSKSGELKELIGDAFVYSMEFYEKNFPHLLHKSQLLHIAQNENDAEVLKVYKESTELELLKMPQEALKLLHTQTKEQEHISINAAVVNAALMCEAMAKNAQFVKENVQSLEYDDDRWLLNETYAARNVVLATGAYESLVKEPYIKLRGVWGHRIDIKTSTQNPLSIHQFVSISSSNNGILAIGATHNVHYHPQTATKPYDIEAGRAELLEKASRTLRLEDIEVLKDYTGLRSGSFDYMPIVGNLVLSSETLQNKNIKFQVKNADFTQYTYYPNMYMINGNGGYGFVLAPYLANVLKESILKGKTISKRISPARFFARWAKKI